MAKRSHLEFCSWMDIVLTNGNGAEMPYTFWRQPMTQQTDGSQPIFWISGFYLYVFPSVSVPKIVTEAISKLTSTFAALATVPKITSLLPTASHFTIDQLMSELQFVRDTSNGCFQSPVHSSLIPSLTSQSFLTEWFWLQYFTSPRVSWPPPC